MFPVHSIVEQFEEAAVQATKAMMGVIRPYQTGPRVNLESKVKLGDGTLVGRIDRESGEAGLEVLRRHMPIIPVWDEEDEAVAASKSYVILKDPLDGTKAETFGASTSTVIVALYSLRFKRIVACAVGHPGTGKIHVAVADRPTYVIYADWPGQPRQDCHVWDGPFEQGSLLVDLFRPFDAHGGTKQVFSKIGMATLANTLVMSGVDYNAYGSNGFHQALVADQGSEPKGVMASLTTAMGGPWDAAFALGVTGAEGVARAYSVTDGRRLMPVDDALDPMSFDILLTANSHDTAERIERILLASFR